MDAVGAILALSIGLAVLYGAVFCYRGQSVPKALVKTFATLALTAWAWMAGGPVVLVAALALSAAGDAFLAGDGDRWLLPGMAAFFAAHVAYMLLFWDIMPGTSAGWQTGAQIVLALVAAGYLGWLLPYLGKMRLPVIAYTAIILMMGAGAIALAPTNTLILVGALMFILSDAILAWQLFREPGRQNVAASVTLWLLYFGGQVLIALGVLAVFA